MYFFFIFYFFFLAWHFIDISKVADKMLPQNILSFLFVFQVCIYYFVFFVLVGLTFAISDKLNFLEIFNFDQCN